MNPHHSNAATNNALLHATMKQTFPLLSKAIVLGLIVLSLSACDKAEQTAKVNSLLPESQEFPTEALTWDEWVAYSGPERGEEFEYPASGEGFQYYGKGFPNISNWKPEDFLPAELFEQKHRDICELPKFTRSTLRSQNGSILLYSDIYELIALAEQGYSNAQSALWVFCHRKRKELWRLGEISYQNSICPSLSRFER